jgi:guanylate cyclase
MYLVFPTALQWTLGGYVDSSASIMYAITASILAVVLVGPSSARWWLIAFVGLAVLSGVLDPIFRERAPEVEIDQIVFSFTMTAIAIAVFAVVPLAFFVDARRRLTEQLAVERKRSDDLLRVVLPASIADRLKQGEESIADSHGEVAVLFADIVGSTAAGAVLSPEQLIGQLNAVFTDFDELAAERDLEKIKTIGDGYMVVAGAPDAHRDDAERIADMAIAMMSAASARDLGGRPVELRIGVDIGPAVAGVVGASKYQYDLYGDTVNTASRMESQGVPGRIQVTERARERLRAGYVFEDRGLVDVKGKGEVRTWFLVGAA